MHGVSAMEAATRLGVSRSTIRRLLKERQIGYVRIGRRVVIPLTELERFAEERFEAARTRPAEGYSHAGPEIGQG